MTDRSPGRVPDSSAAQTKLAPPGNDQGDLLDAVYECPIERETPNDIPRGFGPITPLVSNDTEEGRKLNNRIEFSILERTDDGPTI